MINIYRQVWIPQGKIHLHVYDGATGRKCFNVLPNKVSLSILLHWMAKERSELSKMVMRSSSSKREKRDQMIHCKGNYPHQRKHVKIPKIFPYFNDMVK